MPKLAQCLLPRCTTSPHVWIPCCHSIAAHQTLCVLQDLPYDLYVAHANYVAGGYKRHRFRETGLWSYDHQDYYNKGYYLSFDMKYPEEPPDWEQWDARQRVGMHLQALQLQQDQVSWDSSPSLFHKINLMTSMCSKCKAPVVPLQPPRLQAVGRPTVTLRVHAAPGLAAACMSLRTR